MKILILGSEGFIGNSLVRYYQASEHQVVGCDLAPEVNGRYNYFSYSMGIEAIVQGNNFDACINAGGSGNVNLSVTDPLADFQSNCFDTIRVLDAIRKSSTRCKYLHISSAAVYGNPETLPVNELAACAPLSPYGWHKMIAETICQEYNRIYGLPVIIARPFSIYGPGLKKQIFWDLFQKIISPNRHIILHGTGDESRDFIYIDDVVESIDLMLRKAPVEANIFNVASGIEQPIKNVVHALMSNMPIKKEIEFNQQVRIGDPLNWRADVSKLKSLGFIPKVSFEEGLQKLSEWLGKQRAIKKPI